MQGRINLLKLLKIYGNNWWIDDIDKKDESIDVISKEDFFKKHSIFYGIFFF
jgi:hypothetical protein